MHLQTGELYIDSACMSPAFLIICEHTFSSKMEHLSLHYIYSKRSEVLLIPQRDSRMSGAIWQDKSSGYIRPGGGTYRGLAGWANSIHRLIYQCWR